MVADVVALVLALAFSNIGDGGELYGCLASRELILGDASDQRGKLLVLEVFLNSYGRNRFILAGCPLDLNQGEAAVTRLTKSVEELLGLELPGSIGRIAVGDHDVVVRNFNIDAINGYRLHHGRH